MRDRTRPLSLVTLASLTALLALLLVASPLDAGDKIILESGGRYEGEILKETPDYVKIKTPAGVYTVYRDDIAKIVRGGDIWSELSSRKRRLKKSDTTGWYELGIWCQEQELWPEAIDCFHQVLQKDPDHDAARAELGYRKYHGKWVTDEQYYLERGWVIHEGDWVSPEDKEKLDQGLVQREDGSWGAPEKDSGGSGRRPTPKVATGPKKTAGGGAEPAPRRRPPNPFGRGFGGGGARPPAKAPTPEERKANLARLKASGSWKVGHSSKYYDLYSNGPEAEVKKLGKTMDEMCEEFKKIFAHKEEITQPFPIHLYASQQEFMSRTGRGQGVGGYYDGRKIVAFHGTLGGLTTESVLFHEGTHQFQGLVMGRNMWRAKIWFIEGLAVFFEASEFGKGKVRTGVIPKSRLANLKRAINSGTYVPLSQLLEMQQAQFGALHYAHAWGLIYFLVNGTKGGKERFKEYFFRQRDGDPNPSKSFEELFNKPIDVIEKHWKEYIKNLKP